MNATTNDYTNREPFSMLPASIILDARDSRCVKLFAYCDLVQGQNGKHTARNRSTVADALRWSTTTLNKHAWPPAEGGLIRIDGHGTAATTSPVTRNDPRNNKWFVPPPKDGTSHK